MSDYALQFAAEGLEIPDLPFGEREALALGAPIDQLDALRKAAIYGYILAQADINKTITPEDTQ